MLAATVEPLLQDVRLETTVPPAAATLHLHRHGPSGVQADVRGWVDTAVTAGLVVARDYEAPIGVQIQYTADFKDAGGTVVQTQTATVTVPTSGCEDTWLNDLARSQNTMRILIERLPELSYPVPATVHEIITRRAPIVASDIAHTPAFELSFITATLDERDRARATLGNGVPVLLRSDPEVGIGNMYFAVLGFTEQRMAPGAIVPERRFVVDAREVDRPAPSLYAPSAPSSYADVRANYATYAALRAARTSYDAVLYDWTGEAPIDVVPWPPDDL